MNALFSPLYDPEAELPPWPLGAFVPVHWEHDMGPFAYVIQNPHVSCECGRRRLLAAEPRCTCGGAPR